MKRSWAWMALVVTVAACGPKEAEVEEAPAAEPMSQAGANAMRGAIVDGFMRKDAATVSAFYADDAVLYDADGTVSTGKDAIQAQFTNLIQQGFDSVGIAPASFEAVGDGATETGTMIIRKLDPQTKEATRYNANYTIQFARQADGTFKIAKDSTYGMTEIQAP